MLRARHCHPSRCVHAAGFLLETLADAIALTRRMREGGLDLLNVSIGFSTIAAKVPWGPAFLVPVAQQVRREAELPVASSSCIDAPQDVARAVAEGQMDLVMIGRAHLANPHYPYALALALGEEAPARVLPAPYAHWLSRYRGPGKGAAQQGHASSLLTRLYFDISKCRRNYQETRMRHVMKGRGGGHGGHAGLAMHGGHHRHAGWGGRPDGPDAAEGAGPRHGRFGPQGHGFGRGHGKWHGHGRFEGDRFAAFGRGMEPAPEARGDFRGVADIVEARSDAPARVAVCTGRSCHAWWDSPSLIEDLRREAAASGQRVEITACGCLDQCRNGPVVVATSAGTGRERAFLRTGSRQASEIIAAVVDRKS